MSCKRWIDLSALLSNDVPIGTSQAKRVEISSPCFLIILALIHFPRQAKVQDKKMSPLLELKNAPPIG